MAITETNRITGVDILPENRVRVYRTRTFKEGTEETPVNVKKTYEKGEARPADVKAFIAQNITP